MGLFNEEYSNAKKNVLNAVPTVKTLEELNEAIEVARVNSKECDKANYHKDYYSNPYSRELNRLCLMRAFVKLGVTVEPTTQGIKINDKFLVAWQQDKWRVLGKGKWYWYNSPEQFVEKYIKE